MAVYSGRFCPKLCDGKIDLCPLARPLGCRKTKYIGRSPEVKLHGTGGN